MPLSAQLLEVLVCPKCYGALIPNGDETTLACSECHQEYPIVNGIPVLIERRENPDRLEDRDEVRSHS